MRPPGIATRLIRRALPSFLALSVLPALAETAPVPWPISARCQKGEMLARDYGRCLYDAIALSEKVLEAAMDNALTVIEARGDLAAVQRGRWRSLLDEAQVRFVLFRNFDCQGVAPYEGTRGIGNFEQRSLCLIASNERRANDLRLRYGEPVRVPPAAMPSAGLGTRPATWVQAVSRPVD